MTDVENCDVNNYSKIERQILLVIDGLCSGDAKICPMPDLLKSSIAARIRLLSDDALIYLVIGAILQLQETSG